MHTVSRYDEQDFAEGDAGGNLFKVKTDNHEVKNLHALWDSALLKYAEDFKQPLSESDFESIDKFANEISSEHT